MKPTKTDPHSIWDVKKHAWRLAAGAFVVMLGVSGMVLGQATPPAAVATPQPGADPAVKRKAAGTVSHLYGNVEDARAGPLVSALVTITNEQTKEVHPTATDKKGDFRVLLNGDYSYELRVEYPGFLTFVHSGIRLRAAGDTRWDVELRVGEPADAEKVMQYQQPLIRAVHDEYSDLVMDLLRRGANVNQAEDDGTTALHVAVLLDNEAMIELLLKAGANRNAVNERGENILFLIDDNDDDYLIEAVIGIGADANQVNQDGDTPLIRMANWSEEDRLQLIIDAGANVNFQNRAGNTALMLAAREGNDRAAKVLLDAGADPRLRNTEGKTALDLALVSEEEWSIGLLRTAMAQPVRSPAVQSKPKVPPANLPNNADPPAQPED